MTNESKPKYRIKVEPINGNNEEMRTEYRMGIDCDGFAIIADQEDGHSFLMHEVNNIDIAVGIAKSDELLKSAYIAIGMAEGVQAVKMRNAAVAQGSIRIDPEALGKLFGKEG